MSATAKLLVTASGERFGTVGGGCLEAEIIEKAMDVLERRAPALSTHSLNNELAGDYGLTCGGTAEIFIEPVFPDETLARAWNDASALVARAERGVMVTALDWTSGPGKHTLAADAAADHSVARKLHAFAEEPLWSDGWLMEPITGKPRLVVFGAGHVGARIAEVAALAGWHATVVDDRADFADPRRMPYAASVVTCEFHDVLGAARFDRDTYVVIATRGHQHDAVIASQVAPRNLRYIGMLGSRRKAALTSQQLKSWGLGAEAIARIHAPVGLSIGADTPEEIAVSVVAEMVAVRRTGSSRRGGIEESISTSLASE